MIELKAKANSGKVSDNNNNNNNNNNLNTNLILDILGNSTRRRILFLLSKEPLDRKSTRLNSSHTSKSRMPSSA